MRKKKTNDLEVYKTKKLLETLKSKKGFHTELISVYIPHNRKISDVTGHLKNEISESQNIKSKLTRKNVLEGIGALLGQLRNIKDVPENGLVMYSGAIPQNNTPGTEKNELYIVEPPNKVKTFRYHCASEFLLWPLVDMLEAKETYGLIVVGRKESAVGYIKGDHVEIVRDFTSGIHGKHKAGGQSQKRYERLINKGKEKEAQILKDQFFKEYTDKSMAKNDAMNTGLLDWTIPDIKSLRNHIIKGLKLSKERCDQAFKTADEH